eukprot:CAMPEP_0202091346 /NCGR_PEP_ID=MMETSP0964-20121228/45788_1 /ASSEMBLY_ACC=CAM_ASM_000500 /TAXON_ID=4773 /ORGANISM="Schizochytrium aggregatum, Strain ATCC28209" /LENGTH=263 /DNA_ID=CAMNT_0048659525 /DNA_START=55 /DNA_END=846 /DNA_ORIENTATION=-
MTDRMFLAPSEQVHLYQDETSQTWYLDDDLVPGNGFFARVSSDEAAQPMPPETGWRYLERIESGQTIAHTAAVGVLAFQDECQVGGNYPTLNSTAESRGCPCQGQGSCLNVACEGFTIRLKRTDICLEADAHRGRLMSNRCVVGAQSQRFIYNRVRDQLEVVSESRVTGVLGAAHFVVLLDSYGELVIEQVTSSTQQFANAAKLRFFQDGRLCLRADAYVLVESYSEAEVDHTQCLFMAAAPGDSPLLVAADRQEIWSNFTVI